MPITPVVLCGGEGTRLRPLSRPDRPKPLLPLGPGPSLLADTLARFATPAYATSLLVCGRTHAAAVAALHPSVPLVVEEAPIGTAAAVARAAAAVAPDSLLLVTPADHVIDDAAPLHDAIRRATPYAADGLVLFGATPDRAEPDYGWIHVGDVLGDGVFRVARFEEKPLPARAAELWRGGALWNTGLFLFRAGSLLERLAELGVSAATPGSFDRQVVERSPCLVVPVALVWSDLGSWDAVRRRNGIGGRFVLAPGDSAPQGHVLEGTVVDGRAGPTGAIVISAEG